MISLSGSEDAFTQKINGQSAIAMLNFTPDIAFDLYFDMLSMHYQLAKFFCPPQNSLYI